MSHLNVVFIVSIASWMLWIGGYFLFLKRSSHHWKRRLLIEIALLGLMGGLIFIPHFLLPPILSSASPQCLHEIRVTIVDYTMSQIFPLLLILRWELKKDPQQRSSFRFLWVMLLFLSLAYFLWLLTYWTYRNWNEIFFPYSGACFK